MYYSVDWCGLDCQYVLGDAHGMNTLDDMVLKTPRNKWWYVKKRIGSKWWNLKVTKQQDYGIQRAPWQNLLSFCCKTMEKAQDETCEDGTTHHFYEEAGKLGVRWRNIWKKKHQDTPPFTKKQMGTAWQYCLLPILGVTWLLWFPIETLDLQMAGPSSFAMEHFCGNQQKRPPKSSDVSVLPRLTAVKKKMDV